MNVVLGGVVSVSVGAVAAPLPTLVAVCVEVILLPAITGLGEAEFVTVISAPEVVPTTLDAEATLLAELGSLTDELTVVVPVMTVPFAVPEFTFTTIEKVAAVPPTIFKLVQTTLPVPPTGGRVQVQPAGADKETKVVFAGTASTSVALSAALGPLLVTSCAKVRLAPAATGLGDAALVTLRSALETTLAVFVAVSFVRLISPPPLTVAVLVTVEGAVCSTLTLMTIDG
jgi:hypothetical protein